MPILLFLILSAGTHASSIEPSTLASSPGWQRLLHYKSHVFGGWKSSVDGDGFFLSPEGRVNPEKELVATLEALEKGGGKFGKLGQPVNCAFPARKEFLEKALQRRFPEEPCPQFNDFLAKLDPAGISLVFATSYPNNPASMFGHSFLKVVSRKNRQEGVSLLDWSLNYAAMVPDDENPFAFAFFGLAGGYAGQFALVPYYAKIEEYGYLEGRDIWEYDLNLSDAEILTLLKAVWEIETNAHFDYYFFDENCSYQVLTLLEVARPDWDLSGYFVHMIPGESVKKVAEIPGAIKAVRIRPSLERRLRVRAERLSKSEWAAFRAAREEGRVGELKGAALETYLLFLQAEKKRKAGKWAPEEEARLKEALSRRAKDPGMQEALHFGGESSRPDLSHGAYQIGLGPVLERQGDWKGGVELSLRFAYHDLLDPDPGYMPHSEVLFPHFRFRYSERTRRISLDEAELYSLVSLTPWGLVRKPLAWRARASYRRLLDLPCPSCRGMHGEAGAGAAFALIPERFTLWTMLGAEADGAEAFPSRVRAAPWWELGLLYTLPTEGKILVETRLLRGFGRDLKWRQDFRAGWSHPFSSRWSVRLEGRGKLRLERGASLFSDHRLLAVHYF